MLVLEPQTISGKVPVVEIRSEHAPLPAAAVDLCELGVAPADTSRILELHGGSDFPQAHQLAALIDPRLETIVGGDPDTSSSLVYLDVFFRTGVTDAEGDMASLALEIAGVRGVQCRSGTRYYFAESVSPESRGRVERLLGNALIHDFRWSDEQGGDAALNGGSSARELVQSIALRDAGDDALIAISRRLALALDLTEMDAIRRHFAALQREPTDAELESIALTWSEHCSHKTFRSTIRFDCDGEIENIPGLLRTCLVEPTERLNRPWVRSAFVDNAGIIAFDRQHDLSFKVETHNHPSALEPYGGAHTGVGGVIRDILAVSAEPVANTDVLCFGPLDLPAAEVPAGVFPPARTYREVVRGVADYGNNMGIPTIGGSVLFHRGYTSNPLVYCGTLGIAPRHSHPRDPQPGDRVMLLGGRTGRDGLHGATMSSESLDRETVASSTVQIGAPITEKSLRDVLPHLRDERLYHAITDCGAGGLCSAVGEMGEELGVDVDLSLVPLKYQGLLPWEIWLSEAQERMILAVPDAALGRLQELCAVYGVEVSTIGRFRGDGLLNLTHGDREVARLSMSFMHAGRPGRVLNARWRTPVSAPYTAGITADPGSSLLDLLAHPDIASKEDIIRRYDHEVGAATVVKPLIGRGGPSDAAVVQPVRGSPRGAVVAHGINPLYGEIDPRAMAMLAVDEALRNLVAVGGSIDCAALLDNFCWGAVDEPEELGRLVRAAQGCRDAALAYNVPFISGKDSLRNTSTDEEGVHSIPGTLLISAFGVVPDSRHCATMDFKAPGSYVYVLGLTRDELGGSHYLALRGVDAGTIPGACPAESRLLFRRLSRAIRRGLVRSCHDLSEGGLAVAAAEMTIAGGLGLDIGLDLVPADTAAQEALLFAESSGRFLVEVAPDDVRAFELLLGRSPLARIGTVTENPRLTLRHGGKTILDLPVEALERAWRGGIGTSPLDSSATEVAPISVRQAAGSQGDVSLSAPHTCPDTVRRAPRRSRVRAIVLAAPGINCDRETVEACSLAGADVELVHLSDLTSGRYRIEDFGMLVLPGGFSYGDHLGAGAMLATVLKHRFLEDLQRFAAVGRPVLGICNGFQILCRLGLLGEVSLAPNALGRFECRWAPLWVETSSCIFLRGIETVELPIAHGEGRVVVPDQALPEILARAPLRYVVNPNGSVGGIAGVCNEMGNVLGLMPHPERYLTPFHHPARGRVSSPASTGLTLFENAIRYVREVL